MRNLIFTILGFLSFLFTNCGMNNNSSNELCDYHAEQFNMNIISVASLPDDSTMFEVIVDFDGNVPYAESTHNLMEVRDVHTDLDFIIRNNVRVGQIYKGTLYSLKNDASDCDKEIFDWDNKLK